MPSNIRALAEIVIFVQDMEKSLAFYRDALGLEVFSPPELKGVFLKVAETGGVAQQIVLVPRPAGVEAVGRPQGALHHIGLEVTPGQFENERARLERLGYATRAGEHPFMKVEAFYIDDPDGNEVEIVTARG